MGGDGGGGGDGSGGGGGDGGGDGGGGGDGSGGGDGDGGGGDGSTSPYGEITGPFRLRMWHEKYGNTRIEEFASKWDIEATNQGFSSPSDPYTQLEAGQYAGDIISFLHNWGQRAWENDLLQPVDVSLLQNFENLDDRWQDINSVGENQQWGIPYDVGIYPLTYNTEEFSEAPTSWDILWDSEYEGRITMQDSAIQACQQAALYTGQDPIEPDDFEELEEALNQQLPLVNSYWGTFEQGMTQFVDESVVVGQLTVGRSVQAAVEHGAPVDYTVPQEGAMTYFDEFCIPKNAKNVGTAHAFIDDYLEQGGPRFTNLEKYRATTADLDSQVSDELTGWYAWPQDWELVTQALLSDDVRSQYDQIWTRVKG